MPKKRKTKAARSYELNRPVFSSQVCRGRQVLKQKTICLAPFVAVGSHPDESLKIKTITATMAVGGARLPGFKFNTKGVVTMTRFEEIVSKFSTARPVSERHKEVSVTPAMCAVIAVCTLTVIVVRLPALTKPS